MMTLTEKQLDWLAERISDAARCPKGGRPPLVDVKDLGLVGPLRVYNVDVEGGDTYTVAEIGLIVRDH